MDAILIANSALLILKLAMESIQNGVKSGQISVESQDVLHRKIDALREGDFSGPEWQITPPPSDPTKPAA